MSSALEEAGVRVSELRRAFDAAFAAPAASGREPTVDLIALRLGGRPFAVRLTDLGGFAAARRIVPVPSPDRALLGLSGHRGGLVSVFSLAVLLGLDDVERPRWLLFHPGPGGLSALAAPALEGHLRVPEASLSAPAAGGRHALLARGGEARLVVDLASLFAHRAEDRPALLGSDPG